MEDYMKYDGRNPEQPYETPTDKDFMASHIEALEAELSALRQSQEFYDFRVMQLAASLGVKDCKTIGEIEYAVRKLSAESYSLRVEYKRLKNENDYLRSKSNDAIDVISKIMSRYADKFDLYEDEDFGKQVEFIMARMEVKL